LEVESERPRQLSRRRKEIDAGSERESTEILTSQAARRLSENKTLERAASG
jgi:hypothetical protein